MLEFHSKSNDLLDYQNMCLCVCSPGLWKVVTRFHSNPQQSFSAEFEVKEYGKSPLFALLFKTHTNLVWTQKNAFNFSVLPSFEVKLTPLTAFFYVDDQELTVNIKAKYVNVLSLHTRCDRWAWRRVVQRFGC